MASPGDVSSVNTVPPQVGGGQRSSGGESEAVRRAPAGGNAAPVSGAAAQGTGAAVARNTPQGAAPSAQDVAQAARDITDFVQSVNRSLQISVDEVLGSTIVKVLDSDTDEVIRQIPQEEIVAVARFLEQQLAAERPGDSASVRGLLVDGES